MTLLKNSSVLSRAEQCGVFQRLLEAWRSGVDGDPAFRSQIRQREGIAKVIFEEVFPLYRLLRLKRTEWSHMKFRNVCGSQAGDVVINGAAEDAPKFLEITCADFCYEEKLRMEKLETDGFVSAIGKVHFSGTKNKGRVISVDRTARRHSEIVSEKLVAVREAIVRKCSKKYQLGTALLVSFDDSVAFFGDEDTSAMDAMLAADELPWRERFCALFVLGMSGRRVWEPD